MYVGRIAESDPSMKKEYVRGYTARESVRPVNQATTLAEILHSDTVYPAGSNVLEAGCGVGAQTIILARNSPNAKFTSIDPSEESLRAARERVSSQGFTKNTFIAMVEGVKEQAIRSGIIEEADWELGIRDLYRTTREDGTFIYTFFKGKAQ